MNSKRTDTMKKLLISLLLVLFTLPITLLKAQPIGFEPRVPLKNIYFGLKGGVNATGVRYTGEHYNTDSHKMEDYSFVNLSTLYKGDVASCLVGGLTVERTLPHFSYGLEGVVIGLNALSRDSVASPAKQDSAFLVDIRIPLRVRFLEYYVCSPYFFVAPSAGTYLFEGRSVWNGTDIEWGTKNTRTYHFSVYAGIGMDVKIPMDNYEAKLRVECGWNQGVMNLNPKKGSSRKLEGWEATIGISFPLFDNPSYSWMM